MPPWTPREPFSRTILNLSPTFKCQSCDERQKKLSSYPHIHNDGLAEHGEPLVVARVVPVVHVRHHLLIEHHHHAGLVPLAHDPVELTNFPLNSCHLEFESPDLEVVAAGHGGGEHACLQVHPAALVHVGPGVGDGALVAPQHLIMGIIIGDLVMGGLFVLYLTPDHAEVDILHNVVCYCSVAPVFALAGDSVGEHVLHVGHLLLQVRQPFLKRIFS